MSYTKVPDFESFSFKIDRKKFYLEAMDIAVDDIIEGITRRKAITGGDLPQLEPETIMRKMHDHQLVDKGLLSDGYTYQRLNQWRLDTGRITIKPLTAATVNKSNYRQTRADKGAPRDRPRDEVAYDLQMIGVGKKKKKFLFFGISKDAEGKILDLAGELIQKALEAL